MGLDRRDIDTIPRVHEIAPQNTSKIDGSTVKFISGDTLRCLFTDVLAYHGVREEIRQHVTEGLVQTSERGVDSHGIQLFPHYVAALKGGRINGNPNLKVTRRIPGAAVLHADDTFGHAAGAFAMQNAITIAKEVGIACVAVADSTHCGAAAYIGLMAAENGMIGLFFTHASPHMLYPGANVSTLGPNPICFTAPMEGEEPFCLDMSTTVVTFNRIKIVREQGGMAEPGWGADDEGIPSTDPRRITHLFPIGGYKGYGLGMMIDILSGLLSGMPVGPDVSRMYGNPLSEKRRLGHFCAVINIAAFEDLTIFKRRLSDYCKKLREQVMIDGTTRAKVPGDPEKEMKVQRLREGIPVPEGLRQELLRLAQEAGMEERWLDEVSSR